MTARTLSPDPLWLVLRIIRHRRGLFLLNVLLWAFIHALPLLFGLIVKGVFDALSGASAGTDAWTFLALAVAVDLTRLGVLLGGEYAWSTYWLEMVLVMRRNLLRHLLTAPGSRRLPDSPGEAISRFRDDVDEVASYVEDWVDIWGLLIFALVALAVMFLIDPLMTALILVPLWLTLLLTSLLRPHIRRVRRRMRETTGRVTDFLGELFASAQAVKAAGRESSVLSHFEGLNAVRRTAALRDSLLTELFKSVTDNMVSVATGLILLVFAVNLADGAFGVGDFALFVAYLPRLTSTMSFVGNMMVNHRRTGVSFERLRTLSVDASAETIVRPGDLGLRGAPAAFENILPTADPLRELTVRGLCYRQPDGDAGIADIDLTLKRGSFTVVTGRVGSGKSTLLRVMLGLLPRHEGEIRWNGRLVADPASFLIPPRSAYAAQVPRLFSDSLRENVVMGRVTPKLAVDRAVDLAVLRPDLERLERGLDTPVGTRGVKLSGGQVQRASAARMFMRGADLLIFDDLSSALDVETEARLWEGLFAEGEVTCLVVSNRRAALKRADQIVILRGGRVEAEGTLEELLLRSAEMRYLWKGGGGSGVSGSE